MFFFSILGASALWALAGVTRHQQQRIASMIGINILVDMLMLKSETLQYIAGMAIIALTMENIENQDKIVAGGGVQPLVRLLRSPKTSEKVVDILTTHLVDIHTTLFPNVMKDVQEIFYSSNPSFCFKVARYNFFRVNTSQV